MSVTTTRDDLEALAGLVAVEQCDRDAAADCVEFVRGVHGSRCAFADGFEDGILRGVWDNHPFVQAFARHRARAQEQS